MSETSLLIDGLRAWGDRMCLETICTDALVAALRVFVIEQQIELAHIVTEELKRRRNR